MDGEGRPGVCLARAAGMAGMSSRDADRAVGDVAPSAGACLQACDCSLTCSSCGVLMCPSLQIPDGHHVPAGSCSNYGGSGIH